jgi:soluble lytic murein transglycosylase-like protein
MAGFGDFLQAIHFGVGLAGGFAAQAAQERAAAQQQRLEGLKLLKDDEHEFVPAGDVPNQAGFLGTLFGAPAAPDVYNIAGSNFRLQRRPPISLTPLTDTTASQTEVKPSATSFGTVQPLSDVQPAAPNITTPEQKPSANNAVTQPNAAAVAPSLIKAARTINVAPSDLFALAHVESSFNPKAVGRVTKYGWQAQGLLQLSPDTARDYGVRDVFDPDQNALGGAQKWAYSLRKADGDPAEAYRRFYNPGASDADVRKFLDARDRFQNLPALTDKVVNARFAGPGAAAPAEVPVPTEKPENTDLNVQNASTQGATEQPTTAQGATEQPTTAQPTTAQPTTAQPTTAQPTTAQPTTAQPVAPKPSLIETPYETPEQRGIKAYNKTLQQFQPFTRTKKDAEAAVKAALIAQEKAEKDHETEVSVRVPAEVKKFLENEHRPQVIEAAKDVRTLPQFGELLLKARNTPEVPWIQQATAAMQQALAQSPEVQKQVASNIYQKMLAANFTPQVINDTLTNAGYTGALKTQEEVERTNALAGPQAKAAAQSREAVLTTELNKRAAAVKSAESLLAKDDFEGAQQALSVGQIPFTDWPEKLKTHLAVAEISGTATAKAEAKAQETKATTEVTKRFANLGTPEYQAIRERVYKKGIADGEIEPGTPYGDLPYSFDQKVHEQAVQDDLKLQVQKSGDQRVPEATLRDYIDPITHHSVRAPIGVTWSQLQELTKNLPESPVLVTPKDREAVQTLDSFTAVANDLKTRLERLSQPGKPLYGVTSGLFDRVALAASLIKSARTQDEQDLKVLQQRLSEWGTKTIVNIEGLKGRPAFQLLQPALELRPNLNVGITKLPDTPAQILAQINGDLDLVHHLTNNIIYGRRETDIPEYLRDPEYYKKAIPQQSTSAIPATTTPTATSATPAARAQAAGTTPAASPTNDPLDININK